MSMMRRLLTYAAVVFTLFGIFSLSTAPAVYADNGANPFQGACQAGKKEGTNVGKSPACSTNGSDPITGKNGVLPKIVSLMFYFAGVIALIIIIVSGIRYMTSGGDTQKTAGAKSALLYAVVGLLLVVLARAIVGYIISKTT
jgi:type IV secretory pathway VirB2 component (pilin)